MTTFRQSIDAISPPWLRKFMGYVPRYMYALGLIQDMVAEGVTQAVKSRFPGVGTPTALPVIGRDRRIIRGPNETDTSYAARCVRWLDSWRIAGSPFAVMDALQGFASPVAITVRTVDNSGNWFTLAADGTKSYHKGTWDWDSNPTRWWRFWVIIYATPLWDSPGTYGDGSSWGDGGLAWGATGITSTEIETLRAIVRQWKDAGPYCENIILAFDDTSFDPTHNPGDSGVPDGTWDVPSNRLATAAYLEGT